MEPKTFFFTRKCPGSSNTVTVTCGEALLSPFYLSTLSTMAFEDKVDAVEGTLHTRLDLDQFWCGLPGNPAWEAHLNHRAWDLLPDCALPDGKAWKVSEDGIFTLHLLYTRRRNTDQGVSFPESAQFSISGPTLAHCYIEGLLISLAKLLV